MSSSSSQDKTEKATPQKVRKARLEGQIPRAKEFTGAVIFLLVTLFFYNQIDDIWEAVTGIFRFNMSLTAEMAKTPELMIEHIGTSLGLLITLLLPLFAIILVAAISSNLLLGGWLFHLAGVLPKLSKMNPISGIGRMFSTRSLVELAKSSLKVLLVFAVLYLYLDNHLFEIISMQSIPLREGAVLVLKALFNCILQLGILLFLFGLIDIPYQKWEHMKQLKMTKQEIKEEHKQSEGRPEIKQRIRQIQQQIARRQINKTVPEADVVIINPTHYAVAIKYDTSLSEAPFVVAKGTDETAMHIQHIARDNNVEIVNAPPLTRSIYHTTQLEQAIPSQLYLAVAHILTYVLQLKSFRKGGSQRPTPLPSFAIPKNLQY